MARMTEAPIPTGKEAEELSQLSVSLAHWHAQSWGGAEYLVTKLADVLEIDQIHTIGTPDPDTDNPYGDVKWVDVTGGGLDTVKRQFGRAAEYALWEDVDWHQHGDPDILLSSGGTTRSVLTPGETLHVNYCHSPPRWLYDLYHERKGSLLGQLARPAIRYFRMRDQSVDSRVDAYFANSPIIQRRLWKYYKRESAVLYPPVALDRYEHEHDDGFFLHLGRLDAEKGVPEIVAAFEPREESILFAGGRGDINQETVDRIRRAGNMEYLGFVEESRKYELLATCRAVVFNGINEDFGIVPVEANASGKPCLARNEGFPGIFIEDGENGLLHDGSREGIRSALDRLTGTAFDPESIQSSTEPFSLTVFERRLRSSLAEQYGEMAARFESPEYDGVASESR